MERVEVLRTARTVVTTWVPSDVDDLLALHSDPSAMRFVGPRRPESRAEVERRLETYLAEQQVRGWTRWRVQDHDGTMIGRAGFSGGTQREVGCTSSPRVWGRGLATELLTALVAWHRDNLVVDRSPELWAFATVDDAASRRVLVKVGSELVDHRTHNGALCALYAFDRKGG